MTRVLPRGPYSRVAWLSQAAHVTEHVKALLLSRLRARIQLETL